MNLNRLEKLRILFKTFAQENIIDHILEHIVGVSLLAGTILVSSCWMFAAGPAWEQSQLFIEQQDVMEQRIVKINKLALVDDYTVVEKKLQKELELAEGTVLQKPDLNAVSHKITRLAEAQLLQVASLRLPSTEMVKRHPKLAVEIYPLQLSVKGDYCDLVRFVRKAEEKYHLRGIRMDGNKDGTVKAELEIFVYGMV